MTFAPIQEIPLDSEQTLNELYPYRFHPPNPFNARTVIGYSLPRSMEVSIEVYDVLGRKIETLASGHQPGGYHEVSWYVGEVPSGIYFYRIQAGENTETRKMLLLR